jgi:crotonobetainyl-CoA:carnitine CoA-transferase CaiB-like acyl-CoA transferase
VLTVADLVVNPQLEHRGAFVATPDAPAVRRPRFPAVFTGTPAEPPSAPAATTLDEALAAWPARDVAGGAVAAAGPLPKPLDGVRVLDLSWVLAGPFGMRMLGDLGADVVKLQTAERATGVNDPNHGFYPTFNRSKRSVALNMKVDGALDVMRKLVEQADVLIENYAAGVLARWGLTWDVFRSWNPRLVYVTMSGCGHDGPWQKMISYAPTIHALCGLTALTNPPGRGDVGVGYSLNDMSVGAIAAFSILAALEARERTGEGQLVDLAQLEVGSYLVGSAMLDLLSNGREAVATGNVDPYADFVVNDVFATNDGEVAVTVRDGHDASALHGVIGGGPDALAAWCAGRAADDAARALQAAGVPAGRVQNAHHLFTDDEQLAARAFFTTYDSAVFGVRPVERFPGLWSDVELGPYRPAPAYVGEHAFEILGELAGMSDEEIAEAMADGRLS